MKMDWLNGLLGWMNRHPIRVVVSLVILILLLYLLVATADAQICVRATYVFHAPEQTQQVLDGLQKEGIEAHVCGKDWEPLELWFYPLTSETSGTTYVWVRGTATDTGAVGSVSTYTPTYYGSTWILSLHPNGDANCPKRVEGSNLKKLAGKIGKWYQKKVKEGYR
jgi:hypothetical protein